MVRCPTDGDGSKDEMKMTFIAIIPVIIRANTTVDVSSGVGVPDNHKYDGDDGGSGSGDGVVSNNIDWNERISR